MNSIIEQCVLKKVKDKKITRTSAIDRGFHIYFEESFILKISSIEPYYEEEDEAGASSTSICSSIENIVGYQITDIPYIGCGVSFNGCRDSSSESFCIDFEIKTGNNEEEGISLEYSIAHYGYYNNVDRGPSDLFFIISLEYTPLKYTLFEAEYIYIQ